MGGCSENQFWETCFSHGSAESCFSLAFGVFHDGDLLLARVGPSDLSVSRYMTCPVDFFLGGSWPNLAKTSKMCQLLVVTEFGQTEFGQT